MRIVEQITKTHVEVDRGLGRLHKMIEQAKEPGELEPETIEALRESIESVRRRLERHIRRELDIGDRSEDILGPGMLAEYRIISHHDSMRTSIDTMVRALENGEPGEFMLEFDRFLALFDDYTECERQFLATNAGLLYPGGATA